jgi:hypothetical protein
MKKIIFLFFVTIYCAPVAGQSCEFCGEWIYEGFEYETGITTDCEGTAEEFYKGFKFNLSSNKLGLANHISSPPPYSYNSDIVFQKSKNGSGLYESVYDANSMIVGTFHLISSNILYLSQDGCRFYFIRNTND